MAETNADNSALSFKIMIDGEDLAEIAEVISIHLEKQFCKIPTAQITLYYGSLLNNTFADDEGNAIAVGSEIEISASDDTCLFKGLIVRKSVSLTNRKSLLTLTVKNKAYRMAQSRWNHVFANVTDSDIIEQIIQKYSIGCDVESTSYQHELVTQCNCTDWDFVNLKADANGLLVFADDEKISVMKPNPGSANHEINGYDSILSFDAQIDGRNAFSGIKASSWNYNSQEKQDVEVQNSDSFKQGNATTGQLADKLKNEMLNINFLSSFVDTEAMTGKMNGMMMRYNLSRIIGKVKIYGILSSKPGECVTFSGVGESFLQCKELGDRFAILDVKDDNTKSIDDCVDDFRSKIGTVGLNYGATYYPFLYTSYNYSGFDFSTIVGQVMSEYTIADKKTKKNNEEIADPSNNIDLKEAIKGWFKDDRQSILCFLRAWQSKNPNVKIEDFCDKVVDKEKKVDDEIGEKALQNAIKSFIPGYAEKEEEMAAQKSIVPPSGAIAGIYAQTDNYTGLWKAPANVSIASVKGLSRNINNNTQDNMNVHPEEQAWIQNLFCKYGYTDAPQFDSYKSEVGW